MWGFAVFGTGMLTRVVLLARSPQAGPAGECARIAISLMNTGRYADAYGPGSGPTAHILPLLPILLSVLYRILGIGSAGALGASLVSSAAAAASFALLPALAVAAELELSVGAGAGLAGALLPVNFFAQAGGNWDAPYTALIFVGLFILFARFLGASESTRAAGLRFGLLAGCGLLFSSSLIPVLAAWSIIALVRYRTQLPRLATLLVAGGTTLLILAPWAIRNDMALGSTIWTRSNFGLELQVSNNDLMSADLEKNVRDPNFMLFHPFVGMNERNKVRMLGEVEYNRLKERTALDWIRSHPRRFIWLTGERVKLFWFPEMRRNWQTLVEGALTILSALGVIFLFANRSLFAWPAVAALFFYPAVYSVIQTSARYRFPLEPLLFLLSAYVVKQAYSRAAAALSRLT